MVQVSVATAEAAQRERWMLLIHQLPAKPAYLRVKIWRRLQALGAVAVKNAVHALPASEQSQEDFEWLLKEIQDSGGEALICEAQLIDGLADNDIRELFNGARDADYADIAEEARALAARILEAAVTFEDPGAFKAPWSGLVRRRKFDGPLLESVCPENNEN